jgi:hypothetical protein
MKPQEQKRIQYGKMHAQLSKNISLTQKMKKQENNNKTIYFRFSY